MTVLAVLHDHSNAVAPLLPSIFDRLGICLAISAATITSPFDRKDRRVSEAVRCERWLYWCERYKTVKDDIWTNRRKCLCLETYVSVIRRSSGLTLRFDPHIQHLTLIGDAYGSTVTFWNFKHGKLWIDSRSFSLWSFYSTSSSDGMRRKPIYLPQVLYMSALYYEALD